ncbi:MAG: CHAT domain-containing protein [Bacteroidota bacterium]
MPIQRSLVPYLLACCCAVALLSCSKEIPPEQKQADNLLGKARDAFERKQYHEARQLLWSANTLDAQLVRVPQLAEEYELLGRIYASAASFDSAMLLYARAIEQYKALTDRKSATTLTIETALLHRKMGEERKAHTMLTEALRLARLFKDTTGIRDLLWAVIPTARALDLPEEESSYIGELLNGALTRSDLGEQARLHRESGLSMLYRGDAARAEENFLRTLTFAEQMRDSLLGIEALYRLAITYQSAGKTSQALETYSEALRRADVTHGARHLRTEMLIRVGNVYLGTHAYADAARFYRAALSSAIAAGDKLTEGYCFVQIGHSEVLGDGGIAAATKSYRAALDLFNGVLYPRGASYALQSLGYAARRARQTTEALDYCKQAIEQYESVFSSPPRDDLYAECEQALADLNNESPYDNVIELSLQLGRTDEGFWYASRKAGNTMARALCALDIQEKDTMGLDRYEHTRAVHVGSERQLEYILSAGPREQVLHKDVVAVLEGNMRRMDEASSDVVQRKQSLESAVRIAGYGTAEVQKLIPPGSALVVYVPTRQTLHEFVITSSRVSAQVAAVENTALRSMAKEFISLLRQQVSFEDSMEAQQRAINRRSEELNNKLYGLLVRPVEQDIGSASKLVVLLPDVLADVPVHALRRGRSRSLATYVAERFTVSYLPSLGALALQGTALRTERQVVGLGHPGNASWDVEYELRDIRAFYKDARLYFGAQATLPTLRGEKADVIHVALQTVFSRTSPENSFVYFSDGQSGTTTKRALWGEMYSIPAVGALLFSDLGDDTEMHRTSLVQTLLMSGSGKVVLNSFVPLRKCKKFFGEIFYTSLLGGADVDGAMRAVQLAMIKSPEYSATHMWAPFFLWGK